MLKLVQYHHASDVYEEGLNYVYNMMMDYEKVVTEYGAMPLMDFINAWNVIPRDAFWYLESGDIVYDCVGNQYKVDDEVWEDDCDNLVVNAYHVRPNGDIAPTADTFVGGDLYYKPFYHDASILQPRKSKGEKKICPILITSQAQPQS